MRRMRGGANTQGLLELIDYLPAGPLTMIEIGSHIGESAEIFAQSGKFSQITCIDQWHDRPEVEAEFDAVSERYDVIEKWKASSVDAARELSGLFDFVYIDADHSYEHVRQDINAWLPHVKPGGYIGGHDYNWKFPGVLRAVFEAFGKPEHVFRDGSWLVKIPA